MDDGSIPRKEKAAFREGRKADVGQSMRPGAECAFPPSGRTLGCHVAARRRGNAVPGAARKIATHSAIPGAAAAARARQPPPGQHSARQAQDLP